MSLIESLKTYLLTFPNWASGAPFTVDSLAGSTPTQYGLVQLPVNPLVEQYIDGSSLRQFAFAIESAESTVDEQARIEASVFYENLAAWMEAQTRAGNLPILDTGKIAESIEVLQSGFLFEFGESGVGIYQIQCRMTYKQAA